MADERTAEQHMETLRDWAEQEDVAPHLIGSTARWALSQLAAKDEEINWHIDRLNEVKAERDQARAALPAALAGSGECDGSAHFGPSHEQQIQQLEAQVARLTEERDEARMGCLGAEEMDEQFAALQVAHDEVRADISRLKSLIEEAAEFLPHNDCCGCGCADLLARLRAALHPMNPSNPKEPTCPQP